MKTNLLKSIVTLSIVCLWMAFSAVVSASEAGTYAQEFGRNNPIAQLRSRGWDTPVGALTTEAWATWVGSEQVQANSIGFSDAGRVLAQTLFQNMPAGLKTRIHSPEQLVAMHYIVLDAENPRYAVAQVYVREETVSPDRVVLTIARQFNIGPNQTVRVLMIKVGAQWKRLVDDSFLRIMASRASEVYSRLEAHYNSTPRSPAIKANAAGAMR